MLPPKAVRARGGVLPDSVSCMGIVSDALVGDPESLQGSSTTDGPHSLPGQIMKTVWGGEGQRVMLAHPRAQL